MTTIKSRLSHGFTIVELLIVIVIVAILAAITVVAYNGIQQRARDAQRQSDVASIAKALELYYIDNDAYPPGDGSTTINDSWSTTADASWQNFITALKPYMSNVPKDPISTPNAKIMSGNGYNYAYFTNRGAGRTYCNALQRQMYIIVYRLEGSNQVDTLKGDCPSSVVYYKGASNYRLVK